MPSTLLSIGPKAFEGTVWLENLYDENGLAMIDSMLISGAKATGEVVIPDGITYIAGAAFMDNNEITSVIMPDSVTEMGDSVFYNQTKKGKLVTVTLSKILTSLPYQAFAGTSLLSIDIPDSVTIFEGEVFESCKNLETIKLPTNIKRIEYDVFRNTAWLKEEQKNHTLVVINDTILIDGENAEGIVAVPDGITEIAGGAFRNNDNITEVILPNSVVRMGDNAFWNCDNIQKLTIPNSKTEISASMIKMGAETVIICKNGSTAAECAKKLNLKIEEYME